LLDSLLQEIFSAELAVVSEELEAECDRREGVREGLLRVEIASTRTMTRRENSTLC